MAVSSGTSAGRAARRSAPLGAPIGPGSVLWRVAGDGRSLLPGTAAGILQLMNPGLGAGVIDHSSFFTEPWDRILRSVPQIWATIFSVGTDGDARGRAIRDLHPHIKGTDHAGRRYHALDPDVFWWAHATFTWEFLRALDLYFPWPTSRADKERLYAESITWYRRYGMSDRPVPADLAAFERRFEEICRHELEWTPAAEQVFNPADDSPKPPSPPLPAALRPIEPVLDKVRGDVLRLTTIGSLPDIVRRRFGIGWSVTDRGRFLWLCATIRGLGVVVPADGFDRLFPVGTLHRAPV